MTRQGSQLLNHYSQKLLLLVELVASSNSWHICIREVINRVDQARKRLLCGHLTSEQARCPPSGSNDFDSYDNRDPAPEMPAKRDESNSDDDLPKSSTITAKTATL